MLGVGTTVLNKTKYIERIFEKGRTQPKLQVLSTELKSSTSYQKATFLYRLHAQHARNYLIFLVHDVHGVKGWKGSGGQKNVPKSDS